MSWQLTLLLLLFVAGTLFDMVLELLNLRHLRANAGNIPPELSGRISADTSEKSLRYTIASTRFGMLDSLFDDAVSLIFIFSGLLAAYSAWIENLGQGFVFSGILFFLLLSLARHVLDVPFDVYGTFVLERKFGFNRSSFSTWLGDQAKDLLINSGISAVIAGAAFFLIQSFPSFWWVAVWLFFMAFSVFMIYISPYVLEPLFNKFTPLDNPGLESRIASLIDKAGIKVKGIFTMDASRRTSHTNAYFSGIGRVKRIVIYDTLLEKLSDDELLAVLAHEAGHCARKHIVKFLVIAEVGAFCCAFIAFQLLNSDFLPWLFNVGNVSFPMRLVLLGFCSSIVAKPFSLLSNLISRHFERQADDFAVKLTGSGAPLASALVKLSTDNLSNLHPHPCYAYVHYSHPPLLERVRRLEQSST